MDCLARGHTYGANGTGVFQRRVHVVEALSEHRHGCSPPPCRSHTASHFRGRPSLCCDSLAVQPQDLRRSLSCLLSSTSQIDVPPFRSGEEAVPTAEEPQ